MKEDLKTTKIASESVIRDHLANQRTYLAWVRTSLGIMAFAFVVQRFALFLKKISLVLTSEDPTAPEATSYATTFSSLFGEVLIVMGAFICLLAFIQYNKVKKQIIEGNYQPSTLLNGLLLVFVLSIGLFLAIYTHSN